MNRLRDRIPAGCQVIIDRTDDERLIRGQGAILRRMGWVERDIARDPIAHEAGREDCVKPLSPARDVPGPGRGRGTDDEWAQSWAA